MNGTPDTESPAIPPSPFPLRLARPYLVEVDSFPMALLEPFVLSFSPTLLLLGDGVFVDPYALKRSFGAGILIQRALNDYQFCKTVMEDFNPMDMSFFAVFRLSEFGGWREDFLINAEKAMESHSRLSGIPMVLALMVDGEKIPDWIHRVFRWRKDIKQAIATDSHGTFTNTLNI